MKAVVVYEFDGDVTNGELKLQIGEEINVLQTTLGDGWWEGTNQRGQKGIFPESYVQVVEDNASWDDSPPSAGGAGYSGTAMTKATRTSSALSGGSTPAGQGSDLAGKNFNRFSPFVKSGAEDFVLATSKNPGVENLQLVITPDCLWRPFNDRITIAIADPNKKSKFAGMKEFIEFKVSSPWGEVHRRFKHFDWLHDRLNEKFTFINIPPLPEKVFMGSTDERFVEKRRRDLERYTNRLARHPIIRGSNVFQHFMKTSEENQEAWKAGKRVAEKDKAIGAKLYFYVVPEGTVLNDGNVEQMKKFGKFVRAMYKDIEFLLDSNEHMRSSMSSMSKQFHRMNVATTRLIKGSDPKDPSSANDLGYWDSRDGHSEFSALSNALNVTTQAMEDISKEWSSIPESCLNPFAEDLREYLQLLQPCTDQVEVCVSTNNKIKESERMKARDDVMNALTQRSNVVSAAANAEMNHLHDMRREDFNRIFRDYLQAQIDHHSRIVDILRGAISHFE